MPPRPELRLARRGGAVEFLRLPAALYGAAVRLRGALYDRRWLPIERVEAPVVCVGNLSAGGTGKTPMVIWLVRELDRRGLRPGIVSRGYGAPADGGVSDEARLLADELPHVPQVVDAYRARGARTLITRGCDAVVLDDGFQHRRLARDLDLVLVDATRPWGLPAPREGGVAVSALLPRGLLREPPAGLRRAHCLVLTRVDQASPVALETLRARLEALAPGLPIVLAEHRPCGLRRLGDAGRGSPQQLSGERVELVSGIGNPEAFECSVRALGAEVVAHRRFGDHHAYAQADLTGLGEHGVRVLTTTKDAAKLQTLVAGARIDAWVLEVELALREGASVLAALLDALPPSRARLERGALHEGLAG